MKAVTGPLVATAKSFEDEEGFGECTGVFKCAVEREIVSEAAIRDHPVEDVVAGSAQGRVVTISNANGGDRGQRALLCCASAWGVRQDSLKG